MDYKKHQQHKNGRSGSGSRVAWKWGGEECDVRKAKKKEILEEQNIFFFLFTAVQHLKAIISVDNITEIKKIRCSACSLRYCIFCEYKRLRLTIQKVVIVLYFWIWFLSYHHMHQMHKRHKHLKPEFVSQLVVHF